MIASIALLLGMALPLQAPPANGVGNPGKGEGPGLIQGFELRSIPLSPLVDPFRESRVPALGPYMQVLSPREGEPPGIWDPDFTPPRALFHSGAKAPIEPEALRERLRSLTGQENWERKGARLEVQGSRLLAVHEPALLQALVARLEGFRLRLAPRYEFRVLAWMDHREEEESPPGFQHLDPGPSRALRDEVLAGRRGPILLSGVDRGRPGDSLRFGEEEERTYLGDHNVEIAQESYAGDPVMQRLLLGKTLNLEIHGTPDGESLALFGLFTWRRLPEGIGQIDLLTRGIKILERARVEELQLGFSSRLGMEDAFLLVPGGERHPELRILVSVHRMDPPAQPAPDHAILPMRLLAGMDFRGIPFQPPTTRIGLHLGGPALEMDHLYDLVRSTVDPEIWRGEGLFESFPNFLLVCAPARTLPKVRRLVAFLARDLQRSFLIEIQHEARPEGALELPWEPLGPPLALPLLGGRVGFLVHGDSQNFLSDYNVEVAQDSAIGDPEVSGIFNGTEVLAWVRPLGKECELRLKLEDQRLLELRRVGSPAENLGTLWAPEIRRVEVNTTLLMRPGQSRDLGRGPLCEVPGRGRVETRLRLHLREF